MQKRSTFEIKPLTLGLFYTSMPSQDQSSSMASPSQQASGLVERLSPVGSAQISLSLSKSVASKQSIPPDTCVQESTRANKSQSSTSCSASMQSTPSSPGATRVRQIHLYVCSPQSPCKHHLPRVLRTHSLQHPIFATIHAILPNQTPPKWVHN